VKEKGVGSIFAISLSLLCVVLISVLLAPSVTSNPYPGNTNLLWLQDENITIDVKAGAGFYLAKVEGIYPFRLRGVVPGETWEEAAAALENLKEDAMREITMLFPIPPYATNISVEVSGEETEWEWIENKYPTELGDFPIIEWGFRIPENEITTALTNHGETETKWGTVTSDFTVVVRYIHPIPSENQGYVFLYTLGTGTYFGAYNWWKEDVPVHIETMLPDGAENVETTPAAVGEDNKIIMELTLGFDTRDYVVKFSAPTPSGPEKPWGENPWGETQKPSGGTQGISTGVIIGIAIVMGSVIIGAAILVAGKR
jgi:hypothetical protein